MLLNFAPITFDNKEYAIYRLDYEDEKQLENLRKKYNGPNSFFRLGEYIYYSPMHATGPFFTQGEKIILNTDAYISQTKSLINHLVFRKIFASGVVAAKFNPVTFFNTKDDLNNLVGHLLTASERKNIGYWRGYEIDVRVLSEESNPTYGLLFNIFHEWKITYNCQELLTKEINLVDKYVVTYQKNSVFKDKRELVGKIIKCDEEYAVVQKENKEDTYALKDLYPENSYENRHEILPVMLGAVKAQAIFQYLENNSIQRVGAKAIFANIEALHGRFKPLSYSNKHGFSFSVGDLISDKATIWKSIDIPKPSFVFNQHGDQADTWHDRGLKNYGPYSRQGFTPNTPFIIIICRAHTRGEVSEFVGKFKGGIPSVWTKGSSPYQPYGQGFVDKYRLSGLSYKIYTVDETSIKEYDRVLRQALEENNQEIDLALVESCEDFKKLPDTANPYFFTKAKLLRQGIPSQEVMYENITLPDNRLVYILNNMSLATYAKLGGKPWLTPAGQNVDHELVIGIGNKVFKNDRFSFDRRVVGITTLFSGDGNYLLSNTSKDIPFEDYLQELRQSLVISINNIREKYNWQQDDTLRLVFHVFKPFNNEEIDVIESIVEDLKGDFEVLFAYINISHHHPFLIFDKNQKGVYDFSNYGKLKGEWQPDRRVNFKVSNFQFLLQLTGPNEVKTYKQGMAAPVLIKLHERSTFKDIDYLTKQVYKFSSISWRGFLPASLPVTLDYPNQVADLLGNLRASGYWDEDFISSKLKYKAWFL